MSKINLTYKNIAFFLALIFPSTLCAQGIPRWYNFPDSIIYHNKVAGGRAQDLATSGFYELALQQDDKLKDGHFDYPFYPVHEEDAIAQITRLAKDARIVLINEGHNLPDCRSFILKVLQALKPLGFNAYGAEMFSWKDTALNERGYPLDATGFLVRDPVFGELVRQASQMGYAMFPYEDSSLNQARYIPLDTVGNMLIVYPASNDTDRIIVKPNGEKEFHQNTNSELREINEAKNIMSYLRAHPDAKAIIHVGYFHLCRGEFTMGFHLDTALKEKIISIDQVTMHEHSDTIFEDVFYRTRHFTDYTAFTDWLGQPVTPHPACKTDICVAHPRTQYIDGRPDWLYQMPGRKPFATDTFNRIQSPSILAAYYVAEYEASGKHAIPLDILELSGSGKNPPLLLHSGRFIVYQKGRNGEEVRYYIELTD